MLTILLVLLLMIMTAPPLLLFYLWRRDRNQREHSVLRNFPILGKLRYMFEKMGPELRQYLFLNDNEAKPFSRNEYEAAVIAGEYKSRIIGFGSERDFDAGGFYLQNALYPTNRNELRIDNSTKVSTWVYELDEDNLFTRKEHLVERDISPYLLTEEDTIIIGKETCREPFYARGLVGQSAMSFGSLGDKAITALSIGLGRAGGTWMNTGEGGLSDYHLKGNVDIICQIGPALFGVRDEDGAFSVEAFKQKSALPQVKALAQGAKTRGGHIDGSKVTEEIARIRHVRVGETIDSPNRFSEFQTHKELLGFIEKLREIGGKPVGIKLVVGNVKDIESLVHEMATYQELADTVGLPLKAALPYVHRLLIEHGLRDRIKLFASGKLITADKVAIALALGADLVNIARGLMFNVGCIQAQVCHTNRCPVGVATTDPKLQRALVVDEKSFRVTNYIISLREGLYNLTAAAGVRSPTELSQEHVIYQEPDGHIRLMHD
ncbi:FMN-binding glutamate synthase family protein [Exiguobacterium sp. MMG028]|uniref:FMN-binding glutamate synthase family protein n=1 Tax=Exiguobacterium sp. MMG028 TaxID=3021979 RepID=UPI0022FE223A|nr:FMN-binding glutamate synthase family protein [Exiguobacterium sp. MMG028]MDA5560830.1 FMN-binding glutamate synthase family protein [Exiguobacterium sp. MMG028]